MGRRITVHTKRAQQRRESMRRSRERDKQAREQSSLNPQPLAQALAQWRTQ